MVWSSDPVWIAITFSAWSKSQMPGAYGLPMRVNVHWLAELPAKPMVRLRGLNSRPLFTKPLHYRLLRYAGLFCAKLRNSKDCLGVPLLEHLFLAA
jgi:hypothetical protein